MYQVGSVIGFNKTLTADMIIYQCRLLSLAGYRFIVAEYPDFYRIQIIAMVGIN